MSSLQPRLRAGIGLALVMVLGCAGPATSPGPTQSPGHTALAGPTATAVVDRPLVESIDTCGLLTNDEIDAALGAHWDSGNELGETCTWRSGGGSDGRVIELGPGEPTDFEPGTKYRGVVGESVSGVGAAAIWFAEPERGVLSVGQPTDLALLFFRVTVTRPELDDRDRLAIATELATDALPRFPGMSGTDAGSDVATSEPREPLDTSKVGYADNLLAREQAGYWSLGSGLVRTLQLLAGEVDATIVLNDPDILDPSSADVIAMARQYLIDGPDQAARDEIARLLDKLVFTPEELDQMSAAGQPSESLAQLIRPRDDEQPRLYDPCSDIGQPHPCAEQTIAPSALESKYEVSLVPGFEGLLDAGWSPLELLWVTEALSDSAVEYEKLGSMPKLVVVVVTGFAGQTVVSSSSDVCSLGVYRGMQGMDEARFKQWIAADLADCFIAATFPGQASTGRSWWRRALALYLSNVVYPAVRCSYGRCDLEWSFAPEFADEEIRNNMITQRAAANWIFFQQLEKTEGGPSGIVGLVARGMDAATLASYPGMAGLFQGFAKDVTDHVVADTGIDFVPVSPEKDDVALTCTAVHSEQPKPFDTVRLQLSVSGGESASLDYALSGDISVSWRPGTVAGAGPVAGDWSEELPESLSGDAVMVVTSTQPGAHFLLRVTDLDPSCEPTPPPPEAHPGTVPSPGCMCGFSNFYRYAEFVSDAARRLILGL